VGKSSINKLFFGIGIIILILFISTIRNNPKQTLTPKTIYQDGELYKVQRVIDGDTIIIEFNGVNTTIRLIGIDTPEIKSSKQKIECFGEEAFNEVKKILSGKRIALEQDPSQGNLDKYGRMLAYVFLDNGIFLNKYMIQQGFAYEYTYNLLYKYQSEFKEVQKIAKEKKRGLWADNACEKNWASFIKELF